jgi:hypothetical protein
MSIAGDFYEDWLPPYGAPIKQPTCHGWWWFCHENNPAFRPVFVREKLDYGQKEYFIDPDSLVPFLGPIEPCCIKDRFRKEMYVNTDQLTKFKWVGPLTPPPTLCKPCPQT